MKSHLANWIQGYAIWAAILILSAATFIASIANDVVLPLVLVCVAATLVIFQYSDVIKAFDLWALDKWARTWMGSIGIHEWHTPYHAAKRFCDPKIVRARNDAAAKMNSIMMELVKEPSGLAAVPVETDRSKITEQERTRPTGSGVAVSYSAYEAARARHEQYNLAIARDLLKQLIAGDLMAKGSLTQNGMTQSECIIPTPRWKNMSLDISKAEASGQRIALYRHSYREKIWSNNLQRFVAIFLAWQLSSPEQLRLEFSSRPLASAKNWRIKLLATTTGADRR